MKNHSKKIIFVFLAYCIIFSSCLKNNRSIGDLKSLENNSNVSSTDETKRSGLIVDQNALDVMPVMQAINKNAIIDILDVTDNFIPDSEGITCFLPENCDSVFTFENYYNLTEDGSKYKDSFVKALMEVFPQQEYNEENLLFVGNRFFDNRSENADLPRYIDYKSNVDSGEENVKYFIYQDLSKKNPVFFESTGYLGSNLFRFNRAKALIKVIELTGVQMPDFLELYSPNVFSDYMKSFTPDSTESFKLMNGETRICDAVDFFEDYMNNLSFFKSENVKTKVVRVDLYRLQIENLAVNEKYEVYYYIMNYSFEYKGVLFSYAETSGKGTFSHGYGTSINAFGAMVNNNEVEFIYELQHLMNPQNVTEYENIISMEEAIMKSSEKVTKNVIFSVIDIGLFYAQSEMLNGKVVEEQHYEVFPVWRMTLYNNNDERFYRCYVNALNGEFLSLQGL